MFFKNVTVFQLDPVFASQIEQERLGEAINQHVFRSCGKFEERSMGWAPPLGRRASDTLHSANGLILLCLQTEEKLLPGSVVNQELAERVFEIEEAQARKVHRRERTEIKEQIVTEMLTQAFTRQRQIHGYLDPKAARLIINSASERDIETFTGHLRKTLDSLPITPLNPVERPSKIMTQWLQDDARLPHDFYLEGECDLHNHGTVRCKDQDLTGEEIQAHLNAGKQVTKLALTWAERVSFVLSDDLSIRRIRFGDYAQEALSDIETDTEEALRDAEFIIMSAELNLLIPRLLEVLGGEAKPATDSASDAPLAATTEPG